MSMIFEAPLTGTLIQQGLSNVYLTESSSLSVIDDGKLGTAYDFDGTKYILVNDENNVLQPNTVSISVWLKIKSTVTEFSTEYVYGNPSSPVGFRLYKGGSGSYQNKLCFEVYTGASTHAIAYVPISYNWEHYCCTFDGSSLKIYVNGVLSNTVAHSGGIYYGSTSAMTIGAGLPVSLEGYINDLRIYDGAISQKQIIELAKGLTAHYRLGAYYGNPQLLPNNKIMSDFVGTTHYTRSNWTTTTSGNAVCQKVITPTNLQSILTPGASYIFSYDWKRLSIGNTGSYSYVNSNRVGFGVATAFNSTDSVIKLKLYATIPSEDATTEGLHGHERFAFTVPSASSGYGTSAYFVCYSQAWRTSNTAGGRSFDDIEFTNIKLERYFYSEAITSVALGSEDLSGTNRVNTLWCPHTSDTENDIMQGSTSGLKDVSGFRKNLIFASDANRGEFIADTLAPSHRCYYADTAKRPLISEVQSTLLPSDSSYTISLWVLLNQATSYQYILTDGAGVNSGRIQLLINPNNNNLVFYVHGIAVGASFSSYYGSWTHVCCTYDVSNHRKVIYINGSQKGTNTTAVTSNIHTLKKLRVFSSGDTTNGIVGKISDLRVYTTALSSADVLELYNTTMSVDNNGNLYSRYAVMMQSTPVSSDRQGVTTASDVVEYEENNDASISSGIISTSDIIEY